MRPIEIALREAICVSSLGQDQFAKTRGLQAIDLAQVHDLQHALAAHQRCAVDAQGPHGRRRDGGRWIWRSLRG